MSRKRKVRIFVVMPFWQGYDEVYAVVREAALRAGSDLGFEIVCTRLDELTRVGTQIGSTFQSAIGKADLIVADVSLQRPNVMMEVGYAQALSKRLIILSQGSDDIPFNLRTDLTLIYEMGRALVGLVPRLADSIIHVLTHSAKVSHRPRLTEPGGTLPLRKKTQIFVSYSHEEEGVCSVC